MRRGDSAPVLLNAANEIAVEWFLEGRLSFEGIPRLVGEVMERVAVTNLAGLEDVLEQDRVARRAAEEQAAKLQ